VLLALGRTTEAVEAANQAMLKLPAGMDSSYLVAYRSFQALAAGGRMEEALHSLARAVKMLNGVLESLSPTQQKVSRARAPWQAEILAAWEAWQGRRVDVALPRSGRGLAVEVSWTTWLPADAAIPDKVERRRRQITRLVAEAGQAGAEPTQRHLAQALGVSERTLAQDLAVLKRTNTKKP